MSTPGKNNDDISLDLNMTDKMGLTFFTAGSPQPSRQSNGPVLALHNYNQYNLQFTSNGHTQSPPAVLHAHEREQDRVEDSSRL